MEIMKSTTCEPYRSFVIPGRCKGLFFRKYQDAQRPATRTRGRARSPKRDSQMKDVPKTRNLTRLIWDSRVNTEVKRPGSVFETEVDSGHYLMAKTAGPFS